MAGMYNQSNSGQFGQGMFDNWQTNQYNNAMRDWETQQAQYNQDMDYWGQQNQYDQANQDFGQWSSGQDRMGPIMPRQMPNVIGGPPVAPQQAAVQLGRWWRVWRRRRLPAL